MSFYCFVGSVHPTWTAGGHWTVPPPPKGERGPKSWFPVSGNPGILSRNKSLGVRQSQSQFFLPRRREKGEDRKWGEKWLFSLGRGDLQIRGGSKMWIERGGGVGGLQDMEAAQRAWRCDENGESVFDHCWKWRSANPVSRGCSLCCFFFSFCFSKRLHLGTCKPPPEFKYMSSISPCPW